jgi:pimeloyl-ACP methyl ester carboxylesterase
VTTLPSPFIPVLLAASAPRVRAARADAGRLRAARRAPTCAGRLPATWPPNDAVLHWNQPAVRANCPDRRGYLWVQPVEGPACIRYFASDEIDGARVAIVQFSGDRDGVMDQPPTRIPGNTEALRTLDAQRSRDRAGVPWIFMARPGTYGSSGDHRRRREPVEFHALDAALDALMQRHQLQRIVILGHSGGATAGAALLTMGRTRVACAVLTSGAYGLLERARMLGMSKGRPHRHHRQHAVLRSARPCERHRARPVAAHRADRQPRRQEHALRPAAALRRCGGEGRAPHRGEDACGRATHLPRPHGPHRPAHRIAVRARGVVSTHTPGSE